MNSLVWCTLWWIAVVASLLTSYRAMICKAGRVEKTRKILFSSALFLTLFIAYLVWLILYRTGDTFADYSPMIGFALTAISPWIIAMREFKRGK